MEHRGIGTRRPFTPRGLSALAGGPNKVFPCMRGGLSPASFSNTVAGNETDNRFRSVALAVSRDFRCVGYVLYKTAGPTKFWATNHQFDIPIGKCPRSNRRRRIIFALRKHSGHFTMSLPAPSETEYRLGRAGYQNGQRKERKNME